VRFENGCNKVAIELCVVQFWSEVILVISNRARVALLKYDTISQLFYSIIVYSTFLEDAGMLVKA